MSLPPNDPVLILAAWALLILSLAGIFSLVWSRQERTEEKGTVRGVKFRYVLMPLGFGLFAFRLLLIGYGLLPPQGWGGRLLYFLAACGILGGVAASRIRRLPD